MEIHKAAKLASPHFLWSQETGARSSLYSEPERAASSVVESKAEAMAVSVFGCLLRVSGWQLAAAYIRGRAPHNSRSVTICGLLPDPLILAPLRLCVRFSVPG